MSCSRERPDGGRLQQPRGEVRGRASMCKRRSVERSRWVCWKTFHVARVAVEVYFVTFAGELEFEALCRFPQLFADFIIIAI